MTRTSCTQIFNNKRICKPYNSSPFTAGLHEATDSTAVTSSGWEVESLLTSANHRQMGDRDSERLSNSLCRPSSTGMQAKRSNILHRAKPSDSKKGEGFARKGCCSSLQPTTSREFLLNFFSGAQERRSNEASDKFEKAKQVGSAPALQNGGHISTLRERLKANDWMVKIDLKDAYFTISIHPAHQPFLRFMVNQQPYQFTCLPFGLSYGPWVFTKVMKPSLPSKYGGMYDCLHRRHTSDGESPAQVKGHLEALIYLLTGLGFVINIPKLITTSAQQIEYLGLLVDSTTLHLSLPGEKLHHIRSEIDQIAKKSSQITARQLAQIIGKASQAVLPAPLFYRSLQGDLQRALNNSSQNYSSLLTLSQPPREELTWWQDKLSHWNGKALLHQTETMSIKSDISLQGWGAVCNGTRTEGPWSHAEQQMHINCLKLLAATLAVKAFLKDQRGVSVQLQLDNQTAVAYINNMEGTVSPQLTNLSKALWMWALSKDIVLTAEYIPGSTNCVADTESRTLKDRTDWKLNPLLFRAIDQSLGPLKWTCLLPICQLNFQLETRSNGRSNRCLQPTVGEPERLHGA